MSVRGDRAEAVAWFHACRGGSGPVPIFVIGKAERLPDDGGPDEYEHSPTGVSEASARFDQFGGKSGQV